jgi:hypothetical protein
MFYSPGGDDFICSPPEASGVKRCPSDIIELYKTDSRDCTMDYESYLNATSRSNHTNACVNWNQYYSNCSQVGLNPVHNTISFDNILIAWVAIFQVCMCWLCDSIHLFQKGCQSDGTYRT